MRMRNSVAPSWFTNPYFIALVLFLISFALRSAFLVYHSNPVAPYPIGDEGGYDAAAALFAEDRWLEETDGRAPMTSLLLSIGYRIFGFAPGFGRWVMVFIASLVSPALYASMRLLVPGNSIAPLLGGGFWCFYPPAIFIGSLIQSENPAPLFVLISVTTLVLAFRKESLGWMLFGGVTLAALALTRPQYLFLPFFLCIVHLAVSRWLDQKFRASFWAIGLLGFFLGLAPWASLNYVKNGKFMVVNSRGGLEVACSNSNLDHDMVRRGFYWGDPKIRAHLDSLPAEDRNRAGIRMAWDSITESPFLAARAVAYRARNFWTFRPSPVEHNMTRNDWLMLAPWAAMMGGLLLSFRYRSAAVDWLLFSVILFAFLMTLPFYSFPRIRFPVDALLVVRAAVAWSELALSRLDKLSPESRWRRWAQALGTPAGV